MGFLGALLIQWHVL